MITHLLIKNYALIESLDIDFHEGFSVITGETGAGKSIILGALGLLMGQRADAKAIKAGQTKCVVEGTFDVSEATVAQQLTDFFAAADIDFDGRECLVRREVNVNGKSRAFVNDTPVPVATLRELSAAIIDIHSQHQNLLLSNEHFLLDVLDAVAKDAPLREQYGEAYTQWREAVKEVEELRKNNEANRANRDFLSFQCEQIEAANLQPDEQADLESESEILSHAEEIKSSLFAAAQELSDEGGNVLSALRQAAQSLHSIASVYQPAAEFAERIESARIELEDVAAELDRHQERVDFDPARQTYVDERLATIYDLEKKHHVESIAELLQTYEQLKQQLNEIDNFDELIAEREQQVLALKKQLDELGHQLTAARTAAARTTATALLATLQSLGMPSAVLHFELAPRTSPEPSGFDRAALLFSANKNVPPQDAAQIASGGEIARLMLSLKAFIAQSTQLPTIIFDEIDTGVSGTMAERMAQVMQQMAKNCQVICITHLPQIAALGTHHYRVFKQETADGTSTHIAHLTADERVREIANMLSGAEMTEAAINNAKALLNL